MRPRLRSCWITARALSVVALVALVLPGCPQLLDDDFDIVSGQPDASAGSAGAGGAGGNGGSDAGQDGDAGAAGCGACGPGETCCDDQCVNLATDPQHCGACGEGCPGTTCAGTCTATCAFGRLDCDQNAVTGCEANAASDPENCGSCGAKCALDQECEAGKCVCPTGSANCDGEADNGCETLVGSDPQNCGACGNSCGANQECTEGACTCAAGFADCNSDPNDGCEAVLATDADNCGTCGKSCGDNGACIAGSCGCLNGFQDCTSAAGCETPLSDPQNCGACSVTCGGGTPVCNGTSCVAGCGSGETQCGSSCVMLATDPLNCGSCGNAVGPNQECVNGSPTCLTGFGDCGSGAGCETNLTNDPLHCGACGGACKPGAVCSQSSCQCAASTPKDCGSACRECCDNTDCSDGDPCTTNVCGGSGTCQAPAGCGSGTKCCALGCFECCGDSDCTAPQVCSGNQCVTPTCTSPQVLCSGACVNLETDPANCGGCGIGCGAGRTCSGGKCTPPWVPTATSGAPSARSHAAYTSIGGGVFVWGGANGANVLGNGAIYDVATNSWTAVASSNAPSGRVLASAVWTGTYVIVWGGGSAVSGGNALANGAKYDPSTQQWSAISSSNGPPGALAPFAVWTGARMLVTGGTLADGSLASEEVFLYDPQADSWSKANGSNGPPKLFDPARALGAGDLYVLGGRSGSSTGDTVDKFYRYRVANDAWTTLPPGPSSRYGAFAGWDGTVFAVWGGRKEKGGVPVTHGDGRRYDPAAQSWSTMSATGAPSARFAVHRETGFSARISNQNLLFVGGRPQPGQLVKDGAIYNSVSNAWTPVAAWPSGEDRLWAVAAFAGGELVLWGGLDGGSATATGERLRP